MPWSDPTWNSRPARPKRRLRFPGRPRDACAGKIVEWAVHLRRFDENRTLDRLVERNELNLEIIAKLACVVAASHRRAPIISGANAGQALQRQIEETLISLEAAPGIFAAQAVASLRHAMQQAFARLATLLSERENQGQVRRCHGDLHLRNIVLIEDRPVLFDGIASLKPRHTIPACGTIGGPAASIPVEDLTSENDG